MGRVTAIFENQAQAENALAELRRRGIPDSNLSIVARRADDVEVSRERVVDDDAGSRIGKGALAGAGVGTLFGLAAILIPGVGPFITAGTLATALGATGGAAAAGAIVGGASGALAGAFAKAGYTREEADYYGPAVERGGVLVAVDVAPAYEERVRNDLTALGGRTYGRDVTTTRDVTLSEGRYNF